VIILHRLILSLLIFGLVLTACSGLGGEPQIIATVAISAPALAANETHTEEQAFPPAKPDIAAAAAYARMQSLANPDESDEASVNQRLPIGSFTGKVQHGTAGGSLPADTAMQLQYGNAELGFSFAETRLDDDFSFTFDGIPLTTAFTYTVGAVYRGRLFSRRLPAGHPADRPYHQNITVYDLTDDPFAVSVARIDMFIEAMKLDGLGSGLFVSQIIGYRNNSDRIYTSGRGFDDGREASLLIQFPAGARMMSGDENGRYVVIKDMEQLPDSVIDTLPVLPGDSHEVMVEYFVPYVDGLMLEQAFNNAIHGEITVTLPDSLRVMSEVLSLNANGNTSKGLRVFSGRLQMDTRPRLAFEVSGNPFATSSDDRSVITSDALLPLLLGGGGMMAAMMAGAVVLGRRRQDPSRQIEHLIGQIAQLDERHDQGQINHDLYHQRRRSLKERLGRLMTADSSAADGQRL